MCFANNDACHATCDDGLDSARPHNGGDIKPDWTLLRRPELLILDEATNALDRDNPQIIFRALRDSHGHITLLIVTHRYEEIGDLVDGVVRIEARRIGQEGDEYSLRHFHNNTLQSRHILEVFCVCSEHREIALNRLRSSLRFPRRVFLPEWMASASASAVSSSSVR